MTKISFSLLLVSIFAFTICCASSAFGFQTDSPIADAMQKKDWKGVLSELKNEADVSAAQADGMTALHWAVHQGVTTKSCYLIERGADANAKTNYNVTPLSLACERGHAAIVKRMIKADPELDLESKRLGRETPLMLAARNGNAELVEALVEAGAELDAKEVNGQNALMWAAANGNTAVVDVLVKAGADYEHATKAGFTPLMFAARQGKTETVMRLLDEGIDVNTVMKPKKSSGRNPKAGTSAMSLAIDSGHFELALRLVAKGADPNDARSGMAPLHAITMVRKTERGESAAGDPPPRITGSVNSLDFVREIVKLGADINHQLKKKPKSVGKGRLNSQGMTPFIYASRTADIALMELFLELGADPMLVNADGATALMAAAGVGVIAVGEEAGTVEEVNRAIELLVELGIDVNVVDKNKETAMHGAAYRSFPETATLLAKLGADPEIWNAKNKLGWTPHMIASGKRPGSVKPDPAMKAALDAAMGQE